MKNNSPYFIYQELIKKGKFNVWKDLNFWKRWFECETIIKPDNYSHIEDFYFSELLQISNKMQNLNIDLRIIIYCTENISLQYIRKNVNLIDELMLSITKAFNNKSEY